MHCDLKLEEGYQIFDFMLKNFDCQELRILWPLHWQFSFQHSGNLRTLFTGRRVHCVNGVLQMFLYISLI